VHSYATFVLWSIDETDLEVLVERSRDMPEDRQPLAFAIRASHLLIIDVAVPSAQARSRRAIPRPALGGPPRARGR
jgi:hypothetical protein